MERNNDYSDTLDFRRGECGRWGWSRFSFWRSLITNPRAVNILFCIYKITRSKICDWLKLTRNFCEWSEQSADNFVHYFFHNIGGPNNQLTILSITFSIILTSLFCRDVSNFFHFKLVHPFFHFNFVHPY